MNLTIAPISGKRTAPGRRLCRMLAAIFAIALLTAGPAQADPVQMNHVVRTLKSVQGSTDLQLSLVSQDPVTSGTKTSTGGGSSSGIGASDPKLDALLAGFPMVSDNAKLGIDDVDEEGEVDGTICDCGEILIAGGGFPKWPLLFLTAVPLVFIPDCDDCDEQNEPTPTPPPPPSTPQPTPEPASMLVFGTGLVALGAGLRRRYTKSKLANQNQKTEED